MKSLKMWALSAVITAGAVPIWAQASRTFVSGVGDDVNPCSRTAPCKTFAGAIVKTAPFGEINVLDPGGFGAVTITKSITIDGGGNISGVLTSGTNGIVVAAGSTDTVILRNLDIDGLHSTLNPSKGIVFLSGKQLIVSRCNIYGYSFRGISIETTTAGAVASISDSIIHDQVNNGIVLNAGTTAKVVMTNVQSVNNAGSGLVVASGTAEAHQSVFSNNAVGLDVHDSGIAHFESLMVANNSSVGLQAWGTGPTVWLSNVTLTQNGGGFSISAGTVNSFGNNKIVGNGFNSGSLTMVSAQ